MKWVRIVVSLMALCGTAAAMEPEEILSKADDVRNPSESFFLRVEVHDSDKPGEPLVLNVAIKGREKTLIETVNPPRERGRNLLMLGDNMWAYVPNLKRAVRVALNQKLTGEAANGDISRTRWSGDYVPTLESEDDETWVLMLTANRSGLTYDKIRVWVQKETFHPVKAQYLTIGGKVLKNAEFRAYKMMEGRERPSEIYIQDAVRTQDTSTIKILKMQVRSFPNAIFNKNTMDTNQLRA